MADTTTPAPIPSHLSCYRSCSLYPVQDAPCQCYYGCQRYGACCDDFDKHCDGMAAIEELEKEALAEVAAFSVFYSIIMFVLLLVILLWAYYSLYSHCKKTGGRSYESGVILKDNNIMIVISYIGMSLYVLSMFCYLISNGSLGVQYNSHNDIYGNSQISAIVFWFLGHTLFYILFMFKLYYFIRDTTYNLNKTLQITAFAALISLWLVSFIVMTIWIEEFHNHYHYGSINDGKILACMIIAFASHLWFCLSLVLFFSIVLYKVVQNKQTTLINTSSATNRLSKSELQDKVTEYMTRITVLSLSALFVSVFCMLCWIVLVGMDKSELTKSYLRFCWWLFPLNVLFSFLSMFLALNFHPNMNDIYKKVCICPHAFCKFYCVRATMPSNKQSKKGTQVRDYEDSNEEDGSDEDGQGMIMNEQDRIDYDNKIVNRREESEEEDSSDGSEDNLRANERHQFNPMSTDQTALNSGE